MKEYFRKHGLSIVTAAVITIVFLVWLFLPDYQISKHGEVENAGSYGDIYGSVNALFTSLAFALLIYTALMQREELKLQREELQLTRNEIAKSAKSQEELVLLTRENYEFQKMVRKKDIIPALYSPEWKTVNNEGGGQKSVIILKPMIFPLYFDEVQFTKSPCTLDVGSLQAKKGLIEASGELVVTLRHATLSDLDGLSIVFLFYNHDRTNYYKQKVLYESRRFVLTPTTEVDFAKYY
jgi:hypothetical protein